MTVVRLGRAPKRAGGEPVPPRFGKVPAWAGAKDSIVLMVSALVAAYPGHSLLDVLGRPGTWTRDAEALLVVVGLWRTATLDVEVAGRRDAGGVGRQGGAAAAGDGGRVGQASAEPE